MADNKTPAQRSANMRKIRSANTGPELTVRKMLHAMGLRFRLHDKSLPGKPDIVLRRKKTAVFVHGCFWHSHKCSRGRLPKTTSAFWHEKIGGNVKRDRKVRSALRKIGWRTVIVWQCELKDRRRLEARLGKALA
jgi:DNA mismatch endonuclease (patch repair protein)